MFSTKRVALAVSFMGMLSGCTADVNFLPGASNKSETCTVNCTTPTPVPTPTPTPVVDQTINESYQVPNSPSKVDILFVVDGTPRMFQTIVKLQSRLDGFISALAGADYQAGVMNSSMGSWDTQAGVFPIAALEPLNPYPTEVSGTLKIVSNKISGADWILGRNLSFNGLSMNSSQNTDNARAIDSQPYGAVGASEPMNAIKTFIQNSSANSGFFRPGAMFVPVIISAGDENDGAAARSKAADVVNAFKASFGETAGGIRAVSMIVKPGDSSCLAQYSSIFSMGDGGVYGTNLDQFATSTGGVSLSICQNDYSASLQPITSGFGSNITSISLKQTPVAGSVKIVAVPAADLSYTVSGTTVTFAKPLAWGSKLSISYQVPPTAQ